VVPLSLNNKTAAAHCAGDCKLEDQIRLGGGASASLLEVPSKQSLPTPYVGPSFVQSKDNSVNMSSTRQRTLEGNHRDSMPDMNIQIISGDYARDILLRSGGGDCPTKRGELFDDCKTVASSSDQ
jgi:hypothetical protein